MHIIDGLWHKDLLHYKVVIFDVDGTLYFQYRLRWHLIGAILRHVVRSPSTVRDLSLVWIFRSVRGKAAAAGGSLRETQYTLAAQRAHVPVQWIRKAVDNWMQRIPLSYLYACQDTDVALLYDYIQQHGLKIVIYSDYPAQKKLDALHMRADRIFCATDPGISCLKPNPQGLQYVLHQIGIPAAECLYIGDRYDKDGKAAEAVRMDYLILSHRPGIRRLQMRHLFPAVFSGE